jgi:hypothetical protein
MDLMEKSKLREIIRANLFDGDESGRVTMDISNLLDEVVDIVYENQRAICYNPSLDEALNSGDGTYRP